MEEHLTVGRVAGLADVSVRTLHHYDEIGLVRPSERTAAGYRAYTAGDVERLREVIAYRRLGFGLREIADLVDDPDTDAVAHLRRLRGLLREQRDRADGMVTAIDRELEGRAMGIRTTREDQLKVFGAELYYVIGSAYPATRCTEPRIAARSRCSSRGTAPTDSSRPTGVGPRRTSTNRCAARYRCGPASGRRPNSGRWTASAPISPRAGGPSATP